MSSTHQQCSIALSSAQRFHSLVNIPAFVATRQSEVRASKCKILLVAFAAIFLAATVAFKSFLTLGQSSEPQHNTSIGASSTSATSSLHLAHQLASFNASSMNATIRVSLATRATSTSRVLLLDSFQSYYLKTDNWVVVLVGGSFSASYRVGAGVMVLNQRPILRTANQISSASTFPVTISGTIRMDFYKEFFQFYTRTNAVPEGAYNEVGDGLLFYLGTGQRTYMAGITICVKMVSSTGVLGDTVSITSSIWAPRVGVTYSYRIVDGGTFAKVFIDNVLLLTHATIDASFLPGAYVAFYNREVSGCQTTLGPIQIASDDLCPLGTHSATGRQPCGACIAGTYQDEFGQSYCKLCIASQYQNIIGQSSCKACPAGSFCSTAGLLAPTGNCLAGSYSSGGAASASCTPCPKGSFCPSPAMSAATACPEGSFCPSVSLRAATPCTPGMYCAGTGLAAVSGSCAAGSYSSGGAATSACMTCAAGQYQDAAAQASCKPCPAGAYCLSTWSQIQGDSQGLRARWYKYSSILYSLPPSAELESQAPTVQTFVPNLDYAAVDNAAIGGLNAVSGGLLDRYATRFDGCGCL